jgi:hypothetical protein
MRKWGIWRQIPGPRVVTNCQFIALDRVAGDYMLNSQEKEAAIFSKKQ